MRFVRAEAVTRAPRNPRYRGGPSGLGGGGEAAHELGDLPLLLLRGARRAGACRTGTWRGWFVRAEAVTRAPRNPRYRGVPSGLDGGGEAAYELGDPPLLLRGGASRGSMSHGHVGREVRSR